MPEPHIEHGMWWLEGGEVKVAHCHGQGHVEPLGPGGPTAAKPEYDAGCPQCGQPFTKHGGVALECPV